MTSSSLPPLYGVSQGSVLGPILSTLYTQPLADVINDHSFNYQKFADDTQVHSASQLGHFRSLITDSESCAESVKAWMTQNKLKLNDDRTDALVVGSRVCTCLIDSQSTEIEGVKENNRYAFRKKGFLFSHETACTRIVHLKPPS